MPYSVDRKEKCVYKKKSDGSRGAKVGCTKGDLQKYVSALHTNVNERKKVLNEIKQALKESTEMIETPVELANNMQFYGVRKTNDPMADAAGLVQAYDPVAFGNEMQNGLLPQDLHGFYMSEEEALTAANEIVRNVYETARNLEEKKGKVTEKIQKKINALQKEVNAHLKASQADPTNADDHQAKAEAVLSQIKELRAKSGIVEKSKKPLQEKEKEDKKKLNEDHEVSMAKGSLEAIIRHINELIAKVGDQEKDIPGWIQDHIAKAENYIQQANDQYHESEPQHDEVLPGDTIKEDALGDKMKKVSDAQLEKIVKQAEDEKVSASFASQVKAAKAELAKRKNKK